MEELWRPISEFPNYSISSYGSVRNDNRGRLVNCSLTKQGGVKVGLVRDGVQHTRSVKVLVAEHFIPRTDPLFDTAIHLDGDQQNNRCDNLIWRPRWFAWKYSRQFETIDQYIGVGPIKERKSGLVYPDIVEASLTHGILLYEVQLALVNKIPVFPTWHIFDWVVD
jgi:hypothetical protein